MDELAPLHVSPFVVWAVTCVRIPSAAAARLAADLRALQKGAGTKVVHAIKSLANADDPLPGLFDDGFWFFCHMHLTFDYLSLILTPE